MFTGFQTSVVDAGDTTIAMRRGGDGPPLLLLHGFPETHLMWHAIAQGLADRFTVICPDLPGYGASGKPPSGPDHARYAKKAIARDMVSLMEKLGFPSFSIAGHDRGARVAYRLALDHPERVERLALFDIIPTGEAFDRADALFALGYWPWSLLSQPYPLPERLIQADPAAIVDNALTGWGTQGDAFPAEIRAAYIEALSDPETAHAICEEYRAAVTVDREDDERERAAGRRIRCPTLVLWGEGGPLDTWYADAGGPLGIWRLWANDVEGRAIAGGHFFPEENARETTAELRRFLLP